MSEAKYIKINKNHQHKFMIKSVRTSTDICNIELKPKTFIDVYIK